MPRALAQLTTLLGIQPSSQRIRMRDAPERKPWDSKVLTKGTDRVPVT